MHVYIRRGPQSFHLENGINGATHLISPHLLDKTCQTDTDKNMATSQVNQHYCHMHKCSIMRLWFISDAVPVRCFRSAVNNVSEQFQSHNCDVSQKIQHC